jgi:hypothetical protein
MGKQDGLTIGRLDDQADTGFPGGQTVTGVFSPLEGVLLWIANQVASVDLFEFAPPGKTQHVTKIASIAKNRFLVVTDFKRNVVPRKRTRAVSPHPCAKGAADMGETGKNKGDVGKHGDSFGVGD